MTTNIGGLRLRLLELEAEDQKMRKIRKQGLKEGLKAVDRILLQKDLPYVPEIIRTELISRHYNSPLAGYFDR